MQLLRHQAIQPWPLARGLLRDTLDDSKRLQLQRPMRPLRLSLLVDLVEDGEGGGTQLGARGPCPAQLPAPGTAVAQLEARRGTVACNNKGVMGGLLIDADITGLC